MPPEDNNGQRREYQINQLFADVKELKLDVRGMTSAMQKMNTEGCTKASQHEKEIATAVQDRKDELNDIKNHIKDELVKLDRTSEDRHKIAIKLLEKVDADSQERHGNSKEAIVRADKDCQVRSTNCANSLVRFEQQYGKDKKDMTEELKTQKKLLQVIIIILAATHGYEILSALIKGF